MVKNLDCKIDSLNKTRFILYSLYFFKKPIIPWLKKKYNEFWRKKFVATKKAKFGVPQAKMLQL